MTRYIVQIIDYKDEGEPDTNCFVGCCVDGYFHFSTTVVKALIFPTREGAEEAVKQVKDVYQYADIIPLEDLTNSTNVYQGLERSYDYPDMKYSVGKYVLNDEQARIVKIAFMLLDIDTDRELVSNYVMDDNLCFRFSELIEVVQMDAATLSNNLKALEDMSVLSYDDGYESYELEQYSTQPFYRFEDEYIEALVDYIEQCREEESNDE